MKTYFNTTNESDNLVTYQEKAKSQNDILMAYFNQFPYSCFSASMLIEVLPNAPITSIRRSLTVLTKAGKLRKTAFTVMGMYGRLEYAWTLNNI